MSSVCWTKEYIMGNVTRIENRTRKILTEFYIPQRKCGECWAKFFVGRQANAVTFNGDIRKPYDLECKCSVKGLSVQ